LFQVRDMFKGTVAGFFSQIGIHAIKPQRCACPQKSLVVKLIGDYFWPLECL
jgi:hypothetical protein